MQVEEQADIHRVMSNPSRLLILDALLDAELSVGELAAQIGASLQNTSQHLRVMKNKGILEASRQGQTVIYRIAVGEIGEVCKRMLDCFE